AAWQPFWEKLRERFVPRFVHEVAIEERQRVMRELIFAVKPEAKPGEKAVYSDISFLLLGFALEEITKLPLDHAVTEMVLKPMGLATAYYRRVNQSATSGVDERVAATEQCPWRGAVIQGQVHDDNCWAMGGYAGHAGVFGAAADVLTFARRLYGGFLTRETLARCWTRVDRPPGCERTLGWDTPSPQGSMVGPDFSPNSVGHWGFAGTSLWIDRDAELAVTILTNRVHPSRENNLIRGFRPTLHSALRRELAAFSRKV
ncbi:MAG: serine hydrolase domain-containing protein, partial [Bdellovibrionota bacterium]